MRSSSNIHSRWALRDAIGDENFDSGNYRRAAKLLDDLTQRNDFADFLTSEAYPDID